MIRHANLFRKIFDKNLTSFRNLNFFLYRHNVSKILTAAPGGPPGIPPAISLPTLQGFMSDYKNFLLFMQASLLCVQPGATVKNFDTTWRYRKDGQTAQAIYGWQVGRPSKFFHSKLACPMPIYGKRKATPKVPPS